MRLFVRKLRQKLYNDYPVPILIIIAAVARVSEYIISGCIVEVDSHTYIEYANCLLDGSCIDNIPSVLMYHPSLFRLVGYPFVLAVAKYLFGSWYIQAVIWTQMLSGVISVYLVYKIALYFTNAKVAFISTLLFSISSVVASEVSLLSDWPYAFVLILAVYFLVLSGENGWSCFAAGVAYAMSATIRQTGLFFIPFFIGLAFIKKRTFKTVVFFVMPVIVVLTSYSLWNKHRAGIWEICPYDGYALMDRYLEYAEFDESKPVDKFILETFKKLNLNTESDNTRSYAVGEIRNSAPKMFSLLHAYEAASVSLPDSNKIVKGRALEGFLNNPLRQLTTTIGWILRRYQLFQRNSTTIQGADWQKRVLIQWILDDDRAQIQMSNADLVKFIAGVFLLFISLCILFLNIIYGGLLIFRKDIPYRASKMCLLLFSFTVLFVTSFGSYGMTRFFLPTFSFMIIFGVDCLEYLESKWRQKKHLILI